ncbi:MAG: hypothetical protein C4290_10995 [Chloroflexota bacterium]
MTRPTSWPPSFAVQVPSTAGRPTCCSDTISSRGCRSPRWRRPCRSIGGPSIAGWPPGSWIVIRRPSATGRAPGRPRSSIPTSAIEERLGTYPGSLTLGQPLRPHGRPRLLPAPLAPVLCSADHGGLDARLGRGLRLLGRGPGRAALRPAEGRHPRRPPAQSGWRIYYCTLAHIVTSLEEAQQAGKLSQRLKTLVFPAVLVIDETGLPPDQPDGGHALLPAHEPPLRARRRPHQQQELRRMGRDLRGRRHGERADRPPGPALPHRQHPGQQLRRAPARTSSGSCARRPQAPLTPAADPGRRPRLPRLAPHTETFSTAESGTF